MDKCLHLYPAMQMQSCCHLDSPDSRKRSRFITPLFGDMHELSLSQQTNEYVRYLNSGFFCSGIVLGCIVESKIAILLCLWGTWVLGPYIPVNNNRPIPALYISILCTVLHAGVIEVLEVNKSTFRSAIQLI